MEDLNSLVKSKMNRNLCAVAVTETWLTADIDSTLVTPPGFLCFRTDRACKRNKRGGGTAIFINQCWWSSPKQSFTYARDNIEATAVTCRTKLSCKFLSFIICSIYIPPSTRTPQLTAFFDSFIAFLTPLLSDSLALVSGDFNKFSTRPLSLLGHDNIVQFPTRDQAYLDQVYVNHPSLFATRWRAPRNASDQLDRFFARPLNLAAMFFCAPAQKTQNRQYGQS